MAMLLSTFILYILISTCACLTPKKPPVKSPPPPPCNTNEHYAQNTNACEKTCGNRDYIHLMGACKPFSKCVCNGDLMRLNDDATGPCVTEDQCYEPCPDGDRNATRQECPSFCQPTCQQPIPGDICPAACLPRGCVCKPGYILESENGLCILKDDCDAGCAPYTNSATSTSYSTSSSSSSSSYASSSASSSSSSSSSTSTGTISKGCKGDRNATYTDCTSLCPPTCKPSGMVCPAVCGPPGCQCKSGYVLSDGKCILRQDCPALGCNGDRNATYTECTSRCPRTCKPSNIACAAVCGPAGCQCKSEYVLSGGKCILPQDCPAPASCDGDRNATYQTCPSVCQPTCDNPKLPEACVLICAPDGCVCKPGFVRSSEGKCVLLQDCPVSTSCDGDRNATYQTCPSVCQPTCDNPELPETCVRMCAPDGCVCKPGFVRSSEGKCVLQQDCPVPTSCDGDRNATYQTCPSVCQPTCDNPELPEVCVAMCAPDGCVCKPGFVRSSEGKCVLLQDCPVPTSCDGDRNATYQTCPSVCQPTCDNPELPEACVFMCGPDGCICKPGFVRSSEGKCVLPQDCPVPTSCDGDRNATYQICPSVCQPTCDNPEVPQTCVKMCAPDGCVCKPGFVLSSEGKCVLQQDCPVPTSCDGDRNATYQTCPSVCQSTCDNPKLPEVCVAMCAPDGCVCKPGFVRSSEGKCVLLEDCPAPSCYGDRNATYRECPSVCQPSCKQPNQNVVCVDMCAPDGCVCNQGYLLSDDNKCILPKDCPGGSPICPADEQFVNCKVECPNNFCPVNDNRGFLICDPAYPCPFGCICKAGFKRKSYEDTKCIEYSSCPPVNCTRPNEVWNPKPPKCIAESCKDAVNPQPCNKPYPNYTPQCVCKEGHYRNASDICVPVKECPVCPVQEQCRPTCAVPNPPNCPERPAATTNENGCECQAGYILSEVGGLCIRIEDCPQNQGCNGDPHAVVKSCPWSCPATCDSPNASSCDKKCKPVGCECQSGYILSKECGKCILPDECPCGDPCGPNGTFVDCGFRCPNQYCPEDDSRVQIACKPGRPCPPGCACKINYKRLSYDNDICIEAVDCPPVECTRPDEVWDPCPSDCLDEGCSNAYNLPIPCNTLLLNCQPKCVCKKNYFRNSSDICIPADECDPCVSDCAPTCANPNPINCSMPPKKRCCENGYIQLEKGGKCVKIEDCPKETGCNGDPNAVAKQCPAACPSTCDKPETFPCNKLCVEVGCECAPGYILSGANGQCIKANQCPGGDPCGPNAVFSSCKNGCPTDYCPVNDSRGRIICETYPFSPCNSGCVCQYGFIKNNRKENKCIRPSTCPPVKCTRKNEKWNSCPSACLAEGCGDVNNQPTTCNTLVEVVCQPRCVCTKGHFRNSSDLCVPAADCN